MKLRNLHNTLRSLPNKALVAGAIFAAAVLPLAGLATADTQVAMEGHTKSLNVTKGETEYKDVTNAMVDEVVQVQLWQHNREMPDGAKAINNRVKFTVPTAQGKTQVITGTSSADNADTITDTTTVNLSMDRARIEFIPGSSVFRYNKGAVDGRAECITGMEFPPESCYADKVVPDSVVTDPNGVNLDTLRGGPLNGCNAYHETVTIQVRAKADVVSVNKYVRHVGQSASDWKTSTTAKPGDDLEYKILFKNEGNTQLNDVMVGDNLPKYNSYVVGTTKLYNGNHPDGMAVTTDNIHQGGINVGNYLPGASAYVIIRVKLDAITAYEKCGQYDVRNVGVVRPAGMNEFYNTAQVLINVECKEQPQFSCDSLNAEVTNSANRSVKFTTNATAKNGATISRYIYNFGDGTQEFTTDNNIANHTYAKDGSYVARVKVEFRVNGGTQIVNGDQCSVPLTFKQGHPPVVTVSTPPTKLPETGAGEVIATFVTVTLVSSLGYFVAVRRPLGL
jgi:uncharacterized repeat protein (TIGR01451 family)